MAALLALKDPDVGAYVEAMRVEYERRRNYIVNAIHGTRLEKRTTIPQGTFYCLIEMMDSGVSSVDLASRIVKERSVAFTPGVAFGDHMDGFLRMCFATTDDNIDKAIDAVGAY